MACLKMDLSRRAASDKIMCDKAFNIAKNWKYEGYQRVLASMVYKFVDKKTLNYTNHLLENSRKQNYIHLI